MADPRAIGQVTVAASGTSGAGVTLSTNTPDKFSVGEVVKLYPPGFSDASPIAKAAMTVRYLISAIAGNQLTGTMNVDSYPNAPQVEKGWYIDATVADSVASVTEVSSAAALAAALLVANSKILITDPITLTGSLSSWAAAGNIELSGVPGATIKPPSVGNLDMFAPTGTRSASSALTANAARLDNAIVHTPASAALVFAVGDVIELRNASNQGHQSIVVAVSSSSVGVSQTVTFADYLSVPFTTAATSVCYKGAFIPGIYMHDLHFDANGNTGLVRAINAIRLLSPKFERLSGVDFKGSGVSSGDVAGFFSYAGCYDVVERDITADRCGTQGFSAIQHSNNTRTHTDRVRTRFCGVGYQQYQSNHVWAQDVKSAYDRGRAIAIGAASNGAGTHDFVLQDVQADKAQGLGTGLAFRGQSAYGVVRNGQAHGCTSSGMYMVGNFSGGAVYEHHIVFEGGEFEANLTGFDIDIDPGATPGSDGPYAIEFNGTRMRSRQDQGIGTLFNGSLLEAQGVTVANTTTKTGIVSKRLYPGQLRYNADAGGSFTPVYTRVLGEIHGVVFNQKGTDGVITFTLDWGGTTYIAKATPAIPSGASYRAFSLRFGLTNLGATNAQEAWMEVSVGPLTSGGTGVGNLAGTPITPSTRLTADPSTMNKDTTAAQTLSISATLDAADANFFILPHHTSIRLVG